MNRPWHRRLRRKLLRDRRGVVAVEFALLAPVLVTLLFVTAETANFMLAASKTQSTADGIADLISQESTLTQATLGDLMSAGQLVMAPFPTAGLSIAAVSVRFDSSTGAAAVSWQSGVGGGTISNAIALAAGLGNKGESVIIVRANYQYQPLFLSLFTNTPVAMTKTAMTKPRLGPYIPLT